jgi:hypothetical protein
MVPHRYEQDKSLGKWVSKQRNIYKNNKLGLDRQRILEEIGFAWQHCALTARSSTNDVRGRIICIIPRFGQLCCFSLLFFFACLCRIRIRKLSPAVWGSQTKQYQKNRNLPKATLETKVHLATESDQVPALSRPDKWPLVKSKEAMPHVVVVLWRQIAVSTTKI